MTHVDVDHLNDACLLVELYDDFHAGGSYGDEANGRGGER